jgi:hypothetical protein
MKDKSWVIMLLILLGLFGFYLYMKHNTTPVAPIMDYKPSQEKIFTEPVPPKENTPVPPKENIPVRPSSAFMKGYWDGYHGTWLAPIRWTFTDEYRQGWSQGSSDRKKGIKRYPPETR